MVEGSTFCESVEIRSWGLKRKKDLCSVYETSFKALGVNLTTRREEESGKNIWK